MGTQFAKDQSRDATASIRGYVYQVDMSILRWLTLQQNESLELECGEDIDIIQGEIARGPRTLEQIKVSGKKITLNSDGPKASLANFRKSLLANPAIELKFRYVTTAETGTERPACFPDGAAGLTVWQEVQKPNASPEFLQSGLSGIRAIVQRGAKPNHVSRKDWIELQSFFGNSSDGDLVRFIRCVEWNVSQLTPDELEKRIGALIRTKIPGASEQEARNRYQRLFLFVFKTLAGTHPKILTPQLLEEEFERPAALSSDRSLLMVIQALLSSLEERVGALELEHTTLRTLVTNSLGAASIREGGLRAMVDVPPLVERAVQRKAAVQRIVSCLKNRTWCSLSGPSSSGKTQLSILVARQMSQNRTVWIRLRDKSASESCEVTDRSLEMASETPRTFLYEKWYGEVCRRLGPGALIVLDDLPRKATNQEDWEARLTLLARACSSNRVKLLSTSSEPIAHNLTSSAGSLIEEISVPGFSDEEIGELISLYGARGPSVVNLASIVAVVTRRQTLLIRAAISYLADKKWEVSETNFESLFSGDYAKSLEEPIRKSLVATTTAETREFLYRIKLAGGDFSKADLDSVASVTPKVRLPLEKMSSVLGLWIQREGQGRYSTSPLLDRIPADLDKDVQRRVHLALGGAILAKRKLSLWGGMKAFGHFSAGHDNLRAAFILTKALMSLDEARGSVPQDWGFTLVWTDALPAELPLGIRLTLRSLQAVVCHQKGMNVEAILGDLDRLMEEARAGADDLAVVFSAAWICLRLGREYPVRANAYLLRALPLLDKQKVPKHPKAPERLEGMLWVSARGIGSTGELADWLNTLRQMSQGQRDNLFNVPGADLQALLLCDGLWDREKKKPLHLQDWKGVLRDIDEIRLFAGETGNRLLEGCAGRALIIVHGEFLEDLGEARRVADQIYPRVSESATAAFLIAQAIAVQCDRQDQETEALAWGTRAMGLATTSFPLLRRDVWLLVSRIHIERNAKQAMANAEEAVNIVKESTLGSNIMIETLGEYAITCWRAGDSQRCYRAMTMCVSTLFSQTSDTVRRRRLFVICGHAAGYFASFALQRKPPKPDYVEPYLGMFLNNHPVDDLYDVGREWSLPLQISFFADALNRPVDADSWLTVGVEKAGTGPAAEIVRQFGSVGVASSILKGNILRALELTQGAMQFETSLSIEELQRLGIQQPDEWKARSRALAQSGQQSRQALLVSLVPIAFRIATIRLDNLGSARRLATTVATSVEQVRGPLGKSDGWRSGMDLIGGMLGTEDEWQQLFKRGEEFAASGESGLSMLCFLNVVLRSKLRQSLATQCHLFEFADKFYRRVFPSLYGSILVPFVERFWLQAIETRGFELSAPMYLRRQVEDNLSKAPAERVRAILKAASFDLKVKLPMDILSWLDAKS